MAAPLVTIILTAYNQEKYVGETLRSIAEQSCQNFQLIVTDNASSDGTLHEIEKFLPLLKPFVLIRQEENVGLCRAFNEALRMANGKYVIDLSADDVMHPVRISRQVAQFEMLDLSYGVLFSNAAHIDSDGRFIRNHYPTDNRQKSLKAVPDGEVYKEVLRQYFICTPTMMIRKSVLDELNGYDEALAFEDFDFWVRSAARHRYFYQDEVLTSKRDVPDSLAAQVYCKGGGMLESYYVVCLKAYGLNRTKEEFDLLAGRIRTFIRKCLYAEAFGLAVRFRTLLSQIENPGWQTELVVLLCRCRLPVNRLYRFYLRNLHKYINRGEVLTF